MEGISAVIFILCWVGAMVAGGYIAKQKHRTFGQGMLVGGLLGFFGTTVLALTKPLPDPCRSAPHGRSPC